MLAGPLFFTCLREAVAVIVAGVGGCGWSEFEVIVVFRKGLPLTKRYDVRRIQILIPT